MSRWQPWPSPSAERWLLVATRHPAARDAAVTPERTGGWKRATLLTRCLFFVLGLAAATATFGIFARAGETAAFLVSGAVLLLAAELLITRQRTITSGFEEALWIAGSVLLAAGIVNAGSDDDFQVLAWATAVALLLAAWRLRNPLAATLGALVLSLAVAVVADGDPGRWLGALVCHAIAIAALVLGGRRFTRPSSDRILDWLVVVMPVAGWGWLQVMRPGSAVADLLPLLAPLLFAIAAGATGIIRRTHAPLIALLACSGCVAYELGRYTPLEWHWRLIIGGALGLLAAIVVERWLRTPREGITSLDLGENLEGLDLAGYAGAGMAGSATGPAPAADSTVQGRGGQFGGGGAGTRY